MKHENIVPSIPQHNVTTKTMKLYYHGEVEKHVGKPRIGKEVLRRSGKENLLPHK